MIELTLLFALGFLTASLFGLVAAPSWRRRIVRLAEDRLTAAMPASPLEARAQQDAARAADAAEKVRTAHVLKQEREKNFRLMLKSEAVLKDAQQLAGQNAELNLQMADMSVEAGDLRSSSRQLEHTVERLTFTLAGVERDSLRKSKEIKTLTKQLDRVNTNLDAMTIDMAAVNTQAENLNSRIAALRDERQTLRHELRTESVRAREMEMRLARGEIRIRQLELKLTREVAANADKDNVLERRGAEIARLKQQLQGVGGDLRAASDALRSAGLLSSARKENKTMDHKRSDASRPSAVVTTDIATPARLPVTVSADDIRKRAADLSQRLMQPASSRQDAAMRTEIADIAAGMVALTASREGKASPLPALVELHRPDAAHGETNRLDLRRIEVGRREAGRSEHQETGISLAARARALMQPVQGLDAAT